MRKPDIYKDTCLHAGVIINGITCDSALADKLERKVRSKYRNDADFRLKLSPCQHRDKGPGSAAEARDWLYKLIRGWAREATAQTSCRINLILDDDETQAIAPSLHLTVIQNYMKKWLGLPRAKNCVIEAVQDDMAEDGYWTGDQVELEALVRAMPREQLVRALEVVSIQCDLTGPEDREVLEDAVLSGLADGSIDFNELSDCA